MSYEVIVVYPSTLQIGYVMFYVRTPQTYGQEAIAGAMALLWQVRIIL